MIVDFIHSDAGSITISILWGFALAMLFRKVCSDRTCITVYGPPPQTVHNKIIRWKNKCYKIVPREASCSDADTTLIPVRFNS
jgi:hypothetical protein